VDLGGGFLSPVKPLGAAPGTITDMPSDDHALARARERVAALRAALEASEGRTVRLVETHISWVLLGGALAYKLKKPVRLPFLDFTTLAARRRFCEEEVRLNRRLAPSLYLGVVDVCDGPEGPRFDGGGRVLDVAVRMRRFPDGALWSEKLAAGTLEPRHIDAMARKLGDFHRNAAVASRGSAYGSAAAHERATRRLVDAIEAWRTEAASPVAAIDWPALRAWLGGQLKALAPLWEVRRRGGRVRECHGDLHLANVLQLDGEATAFDGIEFDDELRWIDVLDDIAFLAMDLLANGQRALAFRFVNACLEASGDYDGLPALRFYMVSRALVRAQVTAIGERQGVHSSARCGAADYLELAAALSASADARLAITHGLPGSGKSFVAQQVIEAVGAIRVRSDVERKRLFGLGALQSSHERVPGGIYDEDTTARTYARAHAVAQDALAAGWPIVVDAAFLRRAERAQFAALAAALAVPFSIFDCRAAGSLLRQRLEERQASGADPSEADVAVLERLAGADEPLDEHERAVAIIVDPAQPSPRATLAQRWLDAA
jgi:aminoglycoside phosphotransferase family enzyme/predicted kinase